MNDKLNRAKCLRFRFLHPKIAIPILFLLVLLIAPFAYRFHHLSTIPDPGDPFDVEAFINSPQVADADNAFFDLQKANSMLSPSSATFDWRQLYEELLTGCELSPESQILVEYVKRNKPAMLVWKKGTGKADFCAVPLGEMDSLSIMKFDIDFFNIHYLNNALALLEWRKKNYEKSANWHLVSFNTYRLIQRNSGISCRYFAISNYSLSSMILTRELQDFDFPQHLIEKMLKEISIIKKSTTPLSDSLKVEYIAEMNSKAMHISKVYSIDPPDLSPLLLSWYYYLHAEPDLYYRLTRQCVGNVLPEVDRPRFERSAFIEKDRFPVLFITDDSQRVLKRGQMSPAEIYHAWDQPKIIKYFPLLSSIVGEDRNRLRQDLLLVALRLEIYRRQHGEYPLSLKDVFLNETIPVDPFDSNHEPFKYVRDAEHSSRIWSNGVDGIDNGGDMPSLLYYGKDYGYNLGKKIKE